MTYDKNWISGNRMISYFFAADYFFPQSQKRGPHTGLKNPCGAKQIFWTKTDPIAHKQL
jgi:hypothetical protein